jgi:predicted lipoprotein with Yx(FWY)xxD motif
VPARAPHPTDTPRPPPAAPGGPAAQTAAASLAASQSSLGTILTDGQGRAVYLFAADTGPSSTCAGGCSSVWPPVSTTSPPTAGPGLDGALLGSSRRADGTTQLTYAGHPLYYFVKDTGPGTTAGEGITNFGGSWLGVDPAGHELVQPAGSGAGTGY